MIWILYKYYNGGVKALLLVDMAGLDNVTLPLSPGKILALPLHMKKQIFQRTFVYVLFEKDYYINSSNTEFAQES